jgi:hypothetical protein
MPVQGTGRKLKVLTLQFVLWSCRRLGRHASVSSGLDIGGLPVLRIDALWRFCGLGASSTSDNLGYDAK